jgi:hypothetical protein
MKRLFIFTMIFLLALTVTANAAKLQKTDLTDDAGAVYTMIDVSNADVAQINELKNNKKLIRWCQLGENLLLVHKDENLPTLTFKTRSQDRLRLAPEMGRPFIAIHRGSPSPLENWMEHINILHQMGGHVVFQAPAAVLEKLHEQRSNHFYLEPFDSNSPLLIPSRLYETNTKVNTSDLPVSKEQLKNYIQKLQDFKTRYTYSDGYVKSAKWCVEEFKNFKLEAKLVEYKDYSPNQYNVVAQKNLSTYKGKFYIVCGHLDSTSENPKVSAPGADDNASGSAGVLEAARILSTLPGNEQIRYVLFGGEEAGLKGSKGYVKQLEADGELQNVLGVVNLDMIGFDRTPPLSTLVETKSFCQDFIVPFVDLAKKLNIKTTISLRPWGSDHIPFLSKQLPCFLFIEDEYEANHNYHKTTDLLKDVNLDLTTGMMKVVIEVMAEKIK